jgi:RNA polymerase sigma-70 factor (ECF subfamily)
MAWLKTILRNAFYDEIRRARPYVSLTFRADDGFAIGDSFADSGAPVEVRMEQERGTAALLQAIAELPRPARRVVTLCDLEGMSYEDAAARLGVAVGTVRSRVSRARQVLREKVGPQD